MFHNLLQLLKKFTQKRTIAVLVLVLAVLFVPAAAYALSLNPIEWGQDTINFILTSVLRFFTFLFSLLVSIFITLVNLDITNLPGLDVGGAIDTAWRILRDLSNLFFIIILLVIAFGTMLQIESYRFQRLLPKLIIMAVLINFSKTIALIILDFGQVLMFTFVNAFKDLAVGNLTSGLMIDSIFRLADSGLGGEVKAVATMILMLFMMFLAALVMAVLAILLIVRIAVIWFLIAISPLAYITAILDATKKHANRWWSLYLKTVMFGPTLAFFLWFVFLFIQTSPTGTILDQASLERGIQKADLGETFLSNKASSPVGFTNFLFGIVMLIIGTGMAIKSADFGGEAAGAVWKWGGRKFEEFRMKGGKLRDIPGINLLKYAPGMKQLGAGIQGWRAQKERKWTQGGAKQMNFFQTMLTKGRVGLKAGGFKGGTGWAGQILSRAAAVRPVQQGFRLTTKPVIEEIKRARKARGIEKDREAVRALGEIPEYFARPEEGLKAVWRFVAQPDRTVQIKELEKQRNLLTKATEIDVEKMGREDYQKQLAPHNKVINEFETKYTQAARDAARAAGTRDVNNLSHVLDARANLQANGMPQATVDDAKAFINADNAARGAESNQQHLEYAWTQNGTTDQERNRAWGRQAISNQLADLDTKAATYGAGPSQPFTLDAKGIEARQDRLNELMKQELKLLNKFKKDPTNPMVRAELTGVHRQLGTLGYATDPNLHQIQDILGRVSRGEPVSSKDIQNVIDTDYFALGNKIGQDQQALNKLDEQRQLLTHQQNIAQAGSPTEELARKQALAQQLEKVNQEMTDLRSKQATRSLSAESRRRLNHQTLVDEEMRKLFTDDSNELTKIFEDARRDHNEILAEAVIKKLSNDGNFNDLILNLDYGESPEAFKQFFRDMTKWFHITQQESFTMGKDVAEILRNRGQWTYAYQYVMDKGKVREATPEETFNDAVTMMRKIPAMSMVTNSRLCIGYKGKDGKKYLTPQGLWYLKSRANDYAFPINRSQMNPEQMVHLLAPEIQAVLGPFFQQVDLPREVKDAGFTTLTELLQHKAGDSQINEQEFQLVQELVNQIKTQAAVSP